MIENFKKYSDEWLVNRYQEGEEDALSLLIKRYHPMLIQIIRYQIRGDGPIEDITQECWYSIIEKLPKLELRISFGVWVKAVARHKAIDWIRSQEYFRRQKEKVEAQMKVQTDSEEETEKSDRLDKLHLGIQQLPTSQRIVLMLFYVENLSLIEISNLLGVSKGTIKSRLFYGREKLKEIITKKMEE